MSNIALLKLKTGEQTPREFYITTNHSEVKIGRSPDQNLVVLKDSECSRWHASIEVSGQDVYIKDLNSVNGTWLNDDRVDSGGFGTKLRTGDLVYLGTTSIEFVNLVQKKKKKKRTRKSSRANPVQSVEKPAPTAAQPTKAASSFVKGVRERVIEQRRKLHQEAKNGGGPPRRTTPNEHEQRLGLFGPPPALPKRKKRPAARRNKAGPSDARLAMCVEEVTEILPPNGKMSHRAMIGMWREDNEKRLTNEVRGYIANPESQIRVVVRKRPLNSKERKRNDYDVASCICKKERQTIIIHEPKEKVDLSKYVSNHGFHYDQVIDDTMTNEDVFFCAAYPLVHFVFGGNNATCFAYGQTGSGKTYTMAGEGMDVIGVYHMTADELLRLHKEKYPHLLVTVAFFELYGGQVFDLLNRRKRLMVQENAKHEVVVTGLTERPIKSAAHVMKIIDDGNVMRATGVTSANAQSSRSHAIVQFILRKKGRFKNALYAKLSMIDLAGSERGKDTAQMSRKRRMEGAQINKSLLALKECIRALGFKQHHTPFRASKLTQVLKDSFTGASRTVMIATISPASSNAEHTCNTLRYADRVKELSHGSSNDVPLVPYPTGKEASDDISEEEDVPDEASAMHEPSPQKPKRKSPPKSQRKRSVEAPKRSASPVVAEKTASEDSFESEDEGEVLSPEAVDESFHAVDDDEEDVRDLNMNAPQLQHSITVSKLVAHEAQLIVAHQRLLQVEENSLQKEKSMIEDASTQSEAYDLDSYVKQLKSMFAEKRKFLEEAEKRLQKVQELMKLEEKLAEEEEAENSRHED